MRQNYVKYIKNANKTYPQWNMKVTGEIMDKFKRFHETLCNDGYNIKAANVAEKDNKVYWILLTDNGQDFELEQYGEISI